MILITDKQLTIIECERIHTAIQNIGYNEIKFMCDDIIYYELPIVETLPNEDLYDYLYIDGEYVYSPLGEEKDV